MGPVPNCPNLTPSRDPKQHSKLVFQNGTQSEAENTAKPTSKKTHFNKLKETLVQQSKLRINENRKVPSTPWTLYNEVTTILNTWDFESPKTELKWVRYDQNNNTKNNCSKKALQSGFIAKIPQTGTPNHYPSSPTHCPRKISQLCLLNRPNRLRDERVMRVWNFGKYVAVFLHLLQKICNFPKTKNSDEVLRTRSEPRARKRYMQPYQIRHSRLNGAVEISIRGHFDKKWVPLPKTILSQNPQKGSERYRKPRDTKERSI